MEGCWVKFNDLCYIDALNWWSVVPSGLLL